MFGQVQDRRRFELRLRPMAESDPETSLSDSDSIISSVNNYKPNDDNDDSDSD